MKYLIILFQLALLFLGALSQDQKQVRRSECGGTLKADTNSLAYPGVEGESLIPGEICVWTIHLDTTRDFRFNFTQFDVNASNSSCVNGALRLYSLSNLVPADKIEEFSFCSADTPPDYFYLGGNVAVLALFTSASNSRPGNGFTISWEGTAYDPLQTKHVATYSSAETGAISYPGVGTYASSLAATWLLSKQIDILDWVMNVRLSELRLESCSNPDPCTCDAFIFYEVTMSGKLREVSRRCSNVTSPISNYALPNPFVLAFFTDFIAAPSGASGFSVVYNGVLDGSTSPNPETTTLTSWPETTTSWPETTTSWPETTTSWPETTTSWPETTTSWPETTTYWPESTTTSWETTTQEYAECGETLTVRNGQIVYKPNSLYAPNERCVWVIAPPNANGFLVNVYHPNEDTRDGVTVSSINRLNHGVLDPGSTNANGSISFIGNMLIVTFYSNAVDQHFGFRLDYTVTSNLNAPDPTSVIVSIPLQWPGGVEIKYPAANVPYQNNVIATFIMSPNFRHDNEYFNYAHVKDVSMEVCQCCDAIYVYEFSPFVNKWEKYPNFTICGGSIKEQEINSADMILLVFQSDSSSGEDGFHVEFSVKPY